MTRWLTSGEQRAWRGFLEAAQRVFDEVDRDLQHSSGLSHGDYEILVRLSEAEGGRMRMSDLAERTLFSRSRLSHAVSRLEAAGIVRREPCPDDRRGAFAVLTDAGRRRLADAAPAHVETVRRLVFDRLEPAQVAELERIAEAIRLSEPREA